MKATSYLILLCCLVTCGCSGAKKKEKQLFDSNLARGYRCTALRRSNAADVLAVIYNPETDLLTQTQSIIATSGQSNKGRQIWFTMVAMDENTLVSARKFFFAVDEKPKMISWAPVRACVFECEVVLGQDIVCEPFANDNDRRIAILRRVREMTAADVAKVKGNDKRIGICGAMVNRTLETVLLKLDESPALASQLSRSNGVEFDHINLGKGKAMMTVAGDVAIVKIEIGELAYKFEELPPEPEQKPKK